MREIKFRAIGIDKKWYYGDLRHNGSSNMRIEWEDTDWKAMPPLGTIVKRGVNVRKETIGQYTGLKDKNGKEIYEGDILQDNNGIGRVTWNQNHCSFLVFTNNPSRYHDLESDGQLNNTEVIGNMYDNPELMESEVS